MSEQPIRVTNKYGRDRYFLPSEILHVEGRVIPASDFFADHDATHSILHLTNGRRFFAIERESAVRQCLVGTQ